MIILRKHYLELAPEQREFGIISTIKKGLKKYKKHKDNLKNLDKTISDIAKDDFLSHRNMFYKGLEIKPNRKLGRNLAKDANKNGIRVFDKNKYLKTANDFDEKSNKGANFSRSITKSLRKIAKKDLKENPNMKPEIKKVNNAILNKNTKGIVNLNTDYYERPDVMAHEMGHILNDKGPIKNRIIRKLNKITSNNLDKIINRENVGKSRFYDKKWKTTNLGIKAIVQPKEERNAWENGIKLMKKNGASEEELNKAKELSDLAVKNYKNSTKLELYKNIKNNKELKKLKNEARNKKKNQ